MLDQYPREWFKIKAEEIEMYISEVMKLLKMSKKPIEIYEEKGLITLKKDASGYRVYEENELHILKKVQMLRRMDFSLSEIYDLIHKHDYEVFDKKREKLEKEAFQVATQIQYIDYVQMAIDNEEEFIEVNEDLKSALQLFEDEKISDNIKMINRIDFNKISNILLIIGIAYLVLAFCLKLDSADIWVPISIAIIILSSIVDNAVNVQLFIVNTLIKIKLLKDE